MVFASMGSFITSLILFCIFISSHSHYVSSENHHHQTVNSFKNRLSKEIFPNRTVDLQPRYGRQTANVPCVICRSLKYCQALNNLLIEEIYYPDNLNLLGTCYVLEDLGKRMNSEIFGPGRSFRDTVECREMVLEYLCLFYGSDNSMYRNQCINQEDVSDPNPANHKVAPRYPCRSFCVQVATVCALDPTFIDLCADIDCPPTQDDCTPDPLINGLTLSANLGCDLPFNSNPYVRRSSGFSFRKLNAAVLAALGVAIIYLFKTSLM